MFNDEKPSRFQFWLVWFLLVSACVAFWIVIGTAAHAAYTWRKLEHAAELAQCRGEASEAVELNAKLLSKGRFVRQYDAKSGTSIYTFRGSVLK
jgi:hypothetical protein